MPDTVRHDPVMLRECLDYLQAGPGKTLVDGTLGLGGHSLAMLERVRPGGLVIGLDRDPEALRRAEARLRAACDERGWRDCPFRTARTDFRHLAAALDELQVPAVDGFLFDLGVSSMQLDLPERGFSFRAEGPLDMRMDLTQGETAADLVNELPEEELADLLWTLGEERYSRRIARRIVERRRGEPLRTTRDLEQAVWSAYPAAERHGRIHPATRTFQALRIAVNDELAALEPALLSAADRLRPGGRIVVLSYHSLEDRIVKRTLDFLAGKCRCPEEVPICVCSATRRMTVLTRKPLQPGAEEVERNPRARSARLRAAELKAER
ncbi:MAG: 16S rRNA (cytosine(1402)-N(4))-methyltransferase RsmH [Armatimonadota bacterium]